MTLFSKESLTRNMIKEGKKKPILIRNENAPRERIAFKIAEKAVQMEIKSLE